MKKIKSREDKRFDFINALIMIFICIFIAYPLYYVFMASFTDPAIVNSGKLLLYPEKLFFAGFCSIFKNCRVKTAYTPPKIAVFLRTLLSTFMPDLPRSSMLRPSSGAFTRTAKLHPPPSPAGALTMRLDIMLCARS